jgi:hypothetical protein
MPSRYVTIAILAFWLATASWLFCRDVFPWLQAGPAPRLFKADFSDEVRRTEIRWLIFQDRHKAGSPLSTQKRIGSGFTQIKRSGDRTYSLSTQLDFSQLEIGLPELAGIKLGVKVLELTSRYVVGPKEDLRELASEGSLELNLNGPPKHLHFALEGKVRGSMLSSSLRVRGLDQVIEQPLDPVKVSAQDSFLNPMHLLDRVPDKLHEGQTWPVRMVDPLGDAVMGFLAKLFPLVKIVGPALNVRIEKLFARVSSATFEWNGEHESCWVIDYYRDPSKKDISARTWVRKSDQWILGQEAAHGGSRLVILRLMMNRGASQ